MDKCIPPGARELEYLACIVERAAAVRSQAGLVQWSQGLLQMLLPHQAMVCLLDFGDSRPRRVLCAPPPGADVAHLAQLRGLAERIAASCRHPLPWTLADSGPRAAGQTLLRDVAAVAPGATLVHGTGELAGGAARFILFGMPHGRDATFRYYLELLLSSLYLASQRAAARMADSRPAAALDAPLTGRELEILHRLQQGKINAEIGVELGISARTVKNHVYNIYRKLDVQNRVQAVARAVALSLAAP